MTYRYYWGSMYSDLAISFRRCGISFFFDSTKGVCDNRCARLTFSIDPILEHWHSTIIIFFFGMSSASATGSQDGWTSKLIQWNNEPKWPAVTVPISIKILLPDWHICSSLILLPSIVLFPASIVAYSSKYASYSFKYI